MYRDINVGWSFVNLVTNKAYLNLLYLKALENMFCIKIVDVCVNITLV